MVAKFERIGYDKKWQSRVRSGRHMIFYLAMMIGKFDTWPLKQTKNLKLSNRFW
jgi:hypothetical protein